MKIEIRKYLEDIRGSIVEIETYVDIASGFDAYLKSRRSKSITERLLIVIGEQIARILRLEPGITITGTLRMTGLRNRIVHDYDQIDSATVYNILVRHVPVLKKEVAALLNHYG